MKILRLLLIMLLLLFISVKIINWESLHKHHWPTEVMSLFCSIHLLNIFQARNHKPLST